MTDLPDIKIKTLTSFPSQAVGRTGIDVIKDGANFYLDLDYAQFQITPNVPPADIPNSYNLIWNEAKKTFAKVPFALQAATGVQSLGGKSGILGIDSTLQYTGSNLGVTPVGLQYIPPWAGSLPRTMQSVFEERLSIFDFIPQPQWAAILNYTSTYDCVTAMRAAHTAAGDRPVFYPPGLYNSSGSITRVSTDNAFTPGLKVHGSGMMFNAAVLMGTVFNVTAPNVSLFYQAQGPRPLTYTENSEFFNFSVMAGAGATALCAVQLVAAWNVTIHRVACFGGRLAWVPSHPEIDPVSDLYQCYSVDIEECFCNGSPSWAIEFSGGQSPGFYRIYRAFLTGNPGGGIFLTTGQSTLEQCNVQNNGTYGDGSCGIRFDVAEGPAQVPEIIACEVQENQNYNFRFVRVNGLRMERNRSISHLYASTANSAARWAGSTPPVPAGYIPRPPIHFLFGADMTHECYNFVVEQNVVRAWESKVSGTSIYYCAAGSINYGRILATVWQLNLDTPPQNNITLYNGDTDKVLSDKYDINQSVILNSSPIQKCLVEATSVGGQGINGSAQIFGTVQRDTHSAYNTANGLFTVPYTGQYKFRGQLGIPTAAGATGISLQLYNQGTGTVLRDKRDYVPTGMPDVTVAFNFTFSAVAGDRYAILATLIGGAARSTSPVTAYNFIEIEAT